MQNPCFKFSMHDSKPIRCFLRRIRCHLIRCLPFPLLKNAQCILTTLPSGKICLINLLPPLKTEITMDQQPTHLFDSSDKHNARPLVETVEEEDAETLCDDLGPPVEPVDDYEHTQYDDMGLAQSGLPFDMSARELSRQLKAHRKGPGTDSSSVGTDDTADISSDEEDWQAIHAVAKDDNVTPDPNQREASFFLGSTKCPTRAALLFYLNSGLFRFEQHKDYSAAHDGMPIDLKKLAKDISNEALTDNEHHAIIRRFYALHPYMEFRIQACSSCGIREIERQEHPQVEYSSVSLDDPMLQLLKFTPEEEEERHQFVTSPSATVCIPVNGDWDSERINLGDVNSVYTQRHDNTATNWHLHPELVAHTPNGGEEVTLCPVCCSNLTKKKKPCRPPLSIAAGVDFGLFTRLKLTAPNLHEQMMLARTRLYFALMKVSPNTRGQVNRNTDNPARCHAILFPHNSCEVATFMYGSDLTCEGGLLEPKGLGKLLHMCMVDPRGRPDSLAREVLGTVNLIARPHVISQWLIVLKWRHPFYADLNLTGMKTYVTGLLNQLTDKIVADASSIEDPREIDLEHGHGSDVAQVRNVEQLDPAVAHVREAGECGMLFLSHQRFCLSPSFCFPRPRSPQCFPSIQRH
jgi:hypothetical protein